MPSIYAHARFGRELFELLPEPARACAARYRELFDLGLQGPDILFFYHPITRNYVKRLGYCIHEWPGRRFFHAAASTIRARRTKDASLAYLCGVLCHYALDLVCHPYIDRMVRARRLNHCAIEGAFERVLITEDGLPLNALVTGTIHISRQNANVIQRFYGRTTSDQILSALRLMVWCNDGLRMKDCLLKRGIFFFLRLIGKYDSIAGMVIAPQAQPQYAETDKRLRLLYEEAKPVALSLIQEFFSAVETGQPLSDAFSPTFSG